MKECCKIYVVSHKNFNLPAENLYVPIQVGFKEDLFGEKGLRDNTGDNIAAKNKNYCELTALYWIWKNAANVDRIGICHYRRYFYKNVISKYQNDILKENDLKDIFKNYDIILPEKLNVIGDVEHFYYIQGEGRKKDIDNVKKIITQKYPAYISSLNKVLSGKSASYCNMMITSNKIFSEYCEWLFDILFELEKITDLTGYSEAEARIYGYLSEILLNVWVSKNNYRIKFLPVKNAEYTFVKCIRKDVRNALQGIINLFL